VLVSAAQFPQLNAEAANFNLVINTPDELNVVPAGNEPSPQFCKGGFLTVEGVANKFLLVSSGRLR